MADGHEHVSTWSRDRLRSLKGVVRHVDVDADNMIIASMRNNTTCGGVFHSPCIRSITPIFLIVVSREGSRGVTPGGPREGKHHTSSEP
jgi:hypothetical protein